MKSNFFQSSGISVVIPLYNKENEIKRAVDSVLSQTLPPMEIIVVDDGSTDNGPQIVAAINHPKIKLYRQANAGVSIARNTGVNYANGEFIAFLDADDQWLDTHLETINGLVQKFPKSGMFVTFYVCSSKEKKMFSDALNLSDDIMEGLFPDLFAAFVYDAAPFNTSAIVVPKHIFKKIGGFPAGVQLGEDLDLYFKIALHHPIAYSRKSCVIYHQDAENRLSCKSMPPGDLLVVTHAIEALARKEVPHRFIPSLTCYILLCRTMCLRYRISHSKGKERLANIRQIVLRENWLQQLKLFPIALLPNTVINRLFKIRLQNLEKRHKKKTN